MKVLITDREPWLCKVEELIDQIQAERDMRLMEVDAEEKRVKSTFWGRFTFDGFTFMCKRTMARFYGAEVFGTLLSMRIGLKSSDTSDLYFDSGELIACKFQPVRPLAEQATGQGEKE